MLRESRFEASLGRGPYGVRVERSCHTTMRLRTSLGLAGLLLLHACGSDFVGPMSVIITPDALLLVLDETQQLTVSVVDAEGTAVPIRDVSFLSDDPTVATVSEAGLVTAMAFGITAIRVSTERGDGSIGVRVKPKEFSLTPRTLILDLGNQVQIAAAVLNQYDAIVDQPISWSTSDVEIATVSSAGLVTGVAYGLAEITVESHGALPDTIPLRVGPSLVEGWSGYVGGQGPMSLWLTETNPGTLGGSIEFFTDFRATVSGSVNQLHIRMDWIKTGFETATFNGQYDTSDVAIRGTVRGSGFTGESAVFHRPPGP